MRSLSFLMLLLLNVTCIPHLIIKTFIYFFIERTIKVQFCSDPLSQVIHYETDRQA